MPLLFFSTAVTAIGSFLVLSGAVASGLSLVGELAPVLFAGSSIIAVASALVLDT
jgi:hypothetical protein